MRVLLLMIIAVALTISVVTWTINGIFLLAPLAFAALVVLKVLERRAVSRVAE